MATEVPSADHSRFDVIGDQLTAVDGSVFKTAVRVASLAWLPSKGGGTSGGKAVDGYRLHTHFEILRGVPERMDATGAKPKGKDDEKAVLADVPVHPMQAQPRKRCGSKAGHKAMTEKRTNRSNPNGVPNSIVSDTV